jgi:hypothetical protein
VARNGKICKRIVSLSGVSRGGLNEKGDNRPGRKFTDL